MNDSTSDKTTNPSLLFRLRNSRDKNAWALFVEVYGPVIFSYCRRRNLQDSDAADVSQEVLKNLSKSMANFEYQPERGRFRDWLGKVTHRELLQFWKRRRRANHELVASGDQTVDDIADTSQWDQHFHAELLQLALSRIEAEFENETWHIFEMIWLDQRPAAEVAEKCQTNLGNVYVAKSRVLKRLRAEVIMLCDDLPFLE